MAIEVKIPSPGESISEVTIASWLKADGDFVEQDDELLEIESEKATLSVSAEADGVLKILIQEGADAKVGDVVATIDPDAESGAKSSGGSAAEDENDEAQSEGEHPEPTYSNKQTASVSPESTGTEKPARKEEEPATYATGTPSPAAKKLMDEYGLKAEQINGSGKDGRITKSDVMEKVSGPSTNGAQQDERPDSRQKETAVPEKPKQAQPEMPPESPRVIGGTRNERREPMSRLRQRVAQRLVAVKNETAMLTTFNEVDMSAILKLRSDYKETFEKEHGIRLGFMSLFTRAVTESLHSFPAINAFIDGDDVVYHDYIDIAIAVQAPKGLVVPVIRNAESMSLDEIEKEVARLASRARNNQLTIDEMTGGTFTISNGGVFGSLLSTPILNPPQSGILGMHKIEERPIAVDGQVVIKPMMYLAFSYDHRIIDGRESVGFLVRIKEYLEDPVRMLLHV